MDDGMEDFEIDAADPIERCRRGREALGLEDDSRVDEWPDGSMASKVTEPGRDACLPLAQDVGPKARLEPHRRPGGV